MRFIVPKELKGGDTVSAREWADTPWLGAAAPPHPLPSAPTRATDPFDGGAIEDGEGELPHKRAALPFGAAAFNDARCSKVGEAAEAGFRAAAEAKGWRMRNIVNATPYDYHHHVDFMLQKGGDSADAGQELWVDVKAARALRRGDPPQNTYMFLELHDRGWMVGGRADVIAIQVQPTAFALFDRTRLLSYAEGVLKSDHAVAWPEQALFRVYQRKNARFTTSMTLVPIQDAYAAAGCGVWEVPPLQPPPSMDATECNKALEAKPTAQAEQVSPSVAV